MNTNIEIQGRQDIEPKDYNEAKEAIREIIDEGNSEVFEELIKLGLASSENTKDENGNITSYKIFLNDKNKTLLFYENMEELRNFKLKSLGETPGKN